VRTMTRYCTGSGTPASRFLLGTPREARPSHRGKSERTPPACDSNRDHSCRVPAGGGELLLRDPSWRARSRLSPHRSMTRCAPKARRSSCRTRPTLSSRCRWIPRASSSLDDADDLFVESFGNLAGHEEAIQRRVAATSPNQAWPWRSVPHRIGLLGDDRCSGRQRGTPETQVDRIGGWVAFLFPVLIAGVDPDAEARLSGADRASSPAVGCAMTTCRARTGPAIPRPRSPCSQRRVQSSISGPGPR
jgi:hypothetical protein